jgi:uncharacterized phiE125 gp8 family phage protein
MTNFPYGYPYISPYDSNFDSFGTLRLTDTDPAQTFVEPVAVTDVKDYLRIDAGDTGQDAQIGVMISAAREQAEIFQNRDLVRKQWDLHYDYWPAYRIQLRAPCVSVDLVEYTDLTGAVTMMATPADYFVDIAKQPAIVTPPWNRSWPAFTPAPSSAILVRHTSGYTNASPFWAGSGARVKMGMQMLISAWFEHRIPFERGSSSDAEFPFSVTSCLSYGALKRAR